PSSLRPSPGRPAVPYTTLFRSEDAAALTEDDRIALLSFTGGLVGWDLKARAGRKKVTLELGGNAACIVDADPGASLDHVAERLRSEEHTSELQSRENLVCRLLL